MAAAAAMMGIAGAAVNVSNSIQSTEAQSQVSQYNVKTDQENAQLATEQGAEDARRSNVQTSQFIGNMRANIGASGVQLQGSPLDAIQQTASMGALDALTIQHSAAVKAWGYQNDAALQTYEGNVNQQLGTGRAIAAGLGAGSQVATTYSNGYMRRTG